MDTPDISSKEFVDKFSLTTKEEANLAIFSRPDEIGFSTKIDYPNNILFKPAKTMDGENDSVAVIWVVYRYKQENDGIVPIYIRISEESKYLMQGHYDYDFNDPKSPTKESLERSNKTVTPVELESYGDYFYDIKNKQFIEKHSPIAPIKMIDDLYKLHTKTAHKFSGIPFRSKAIIKDYTVNILRNLITILKYILEHLFGRKLEKKGYDDLQTWFSSELYKKEDLLPTSPSKIDILGFKTNITKQSFGTLCFLVVAFGFLNTYLLQINFERAKKLFENEIFVGSLIILLIYVFDSWIPFLFFWTINLFTKTKNKLMFMKLKIK